MIIRINDENKVVSILTGKIFENTEVDNLKSFKVDNIISVSANEILFFNPETKEFYTKIKSAVRALSDEECKVISEARRGKERALKWLADNDWKVNKRTLGEWPEDDERWLEYLQGRAVARQKIDMANLIINKK